MYQPAKVYIDKEARKEVLTKKVLGKLNGVPKESVSDGKPDIFGKENLYITKQKGEFLKRCPGTKNYLCCRYYFLNFSTNCTMNCSYCILQTYINNPFLILYANFDDMIREVDEKLDKNRNRFFRIGTGELTDSLCLDHLTDLSKKLVPFFARKENAILELKTKTDQVSNLLGLKHNGKTVVSWSLNSKKISKNEEYGAVRVVDRLKAARKCQDDGYRISFHFDPIIVYRGWEKDYKEVIDMIFDYVNPASIAWISFGCFRFIPQLKKIIEGNFPKSKYIYGEFFPGLDGKMRYFKPIRVDVYGRLYSWMRQYSKDVFVYMCMESADVWKKSFGWTPKSNAELAGMLDEQVN